MLTITIKYPCKKMRAERVSLEDKKLTIAFLKKLHPHFDFFYLHHTWGAKSQEYPLNSASALALARSVWRDCSVLTFVARHSPVVQSPQAKLKRAGPRTQLDGFQSCTGIEITPAVLAANAVVNMARSSAPIKDTRKFLAEFNSFLGLATEAVAQALLPRVVVLLLHFSVGAEVFSRLIPESKVD